MVMQWLDHGYSYTQETSLPQLYPNEKPGLRIPSLGQQGS